MFMSRRSVQIEFLENLYLDYPTSSLLGVLGLGSLHEEREELGSRINFAQHAEDDPDIFTNHILRLSDLKESNDHLTLNGKLSR